MTIICLLNEGLCLLNEDFSKIMICYCTMVNLDQLVGSGSSPSWQLTGSCGSTVANLYDQLHSLSTKNHQKDHQSPKCPQKTIYKVFIYCLIILTGGTFEITTTAGHRDHHTSAASN